MAQYKVAVIRGDGIGVEVIEEGIKVLEALSEQFVISWQFEEHPWSSEYYIKNGQMMPSDGLDILAKADVICLGVVGHLDIWDHEDSSQREYRPGTPVPVDVRASTCHSSRHRGNPQVKSSGGDRVRIHDAETPGRRRSGGLG